MYKITCYNVLTAGHRHRYLVFRAFLAGNARVRSDPLRAIPVLLGNLVMVNVRLENRYWVKLCVIEDVSLKCGTVFQIRA